MENNINKKHYVIFIEQDPGGSEFLDSVKVAAANAKVDLVIVGTVDEAKAKITELKNEDNNLVAAMTPILYPDLINIIKTIPQIDPFAQFIFLFSKNEENIAKNVISSYMLVGVERQLAQQNVNELTSMLSQAVNVVSQRRRQRTSL